MSSAAEVIDATNGVTPDSDELATFNAASLFHGEIVTETSLAQREVEENIFLIRKQVATLSDGTLRLHRHRHVAYLSRALDYLPAEYTGLSAAQPWIAFWIVHALDLLGADIPPETSSRLVAHMRRCRDTATGGFGGGPGQAGHLATSYAAVAMLCTLGTQEAYDAVDVPEIHRFLRSLKTPAGSFRVSTRGESDVRALYSGLAIASMTGLVTRDPELLTGCAGYVARLQAFDGGFGGEEGNEAHGGNTYCGTAALVALGELGSVDTERLFDWAVMRQMAYEGGFQGRTNKLVDSCYSFWVGACFPLFAYADATAPYHPVGGVSAEGKERSGMFDGERVQRYVLECAQVRRGGFRDKPGMMPDYLHTCYSLSGLSVAQEYGGATLSEDISVKETDPVYNISKQKAVEARLHFDERY